MTHTPTLGLLLDVDGPLASTVTRTMRVPTLAPDLVALAKAGCPIVFNTGRSTDFLAEQVVPRLVEAGMSANAPVWGVGEKGGTWFSFLPDTADPVMGEVLRDETLVPPHALIDEVRAIAERFSDIVFFDETKRTMLSIEHHVDVPNETFIAARTSMVAEIEEAIERTGAESMSIYPTVISIDVEHVNSGKALGARRALGLISERMTPPRTWFTAGDSGQDYDMSRQLHELGFTTTHLDVRPHGQVPEVAFEVIRERPRFDEGVAEDDITARHIARLRSQLAC
ncbi:hypothetical protein [Microbacterium amylolyticum]|uniref:Hydroxymethylpyrimidine pyrophosphatase-like HAD family hydrolase n=1 Tax=Microbacterium amylolyticum TaxID=936337 RepID=A0ABS4ZEF3_9MICO|nr:hypothetical protein [Microbacterium amylolyticum]MBP2435673.1 hydroxymethylpyrimidine pyrophosphatase-like HAD family hydrolase [Microbacterium amylolyticum]